MGILVAAYPKYEFRIRSRLYKSEINNSLNAVDNRLGVEQFIDGFILPESGLLEIKDKNDNWRLILLGEAKYQGRDIENFENGWRDKSVIKQDKFTMTAGNVIERGFKNIVEVQNYMMGEMHFPYVILAYGSNFITEEMILDWPGDKHSKPQKVKLSPTDGSLNRIDRMTAGTYGMPINTNHCRYYSKRWNNTSTNVILRTANRIFNAANNGNILGYILDFNRSARGK